MSSVAIDTSPGRATGAASPAGFRATFASEWFKLTTLRSTWILLALAAVLSIGLTALLNWTIGWSWSEWTAADQASLDPIMTSFSGTMLSGILGIVIGVQLVTNEYASGMIRQTMTTTPNRTRVLLAKALVIVGFLVIPIVLITFGTVWVGQLVFGAYDVPTASVLERENFLTLLAISVSGVFYPVFGVALGFVLRSAAGAITTILALMFVPSMFGTLFPQRIQENVIAWLPGNVIDALVMGHWFENEPMYLDQPVAAVGVVAWLVIVIGGAAWLLERRDV